MFEYPEGSMDARMDAAAAFIRLGLIGRPVGILRHEVREDRLPSDAAGASRRERRAAKERARDAQAGEVKTVASANSVAGNGRAEPKLLPFDDPAIVAACEEVTRAGGITNRLVSNLRGTGFYALKKHLRNP